MTGCPGPDGFCACPHDCCIDSFDGRCRCPDCACRAYLDRSTPAPLELKSTALFAEMWRSA